MLIIKTVPSGCVAGTAAIMTPLTGLLTSSYTVAADHTKEPEYWWALHSGQR